MKRPNVPGTAAPRPTLKVFAFVCGCVTEGRRDGPRVQQCDGSACRYTPAPPPGTRRYRARG